MVTNKYYRNITAVLASVIIAFSSFLFSCTDDVDETLLGLKNEITFSSPVTEGITRAVAGEIPTKYPQGENFKVFGKKYTPPYQGWANATPEYDTGGEEVTYKDVYKGWATTSEVHRWDNASSYTFGAYSPADAAGTMNYNETGLTVTDFAPAALGNQYDLLYSKRIYGITRNSIVSGDYNGVPITFYHALSSIIIKIGVNPAFIKEMKDKNTPVKPGDFKVKSIKVMSVVNKGNFQQHITEQISGNDITYTENPEWTLSTSPADKIEYTMLSKETNMPVIDNVTLIKDAVQSLTELGGHMAILIPQPLTDISLEIQWTQNGNSKKPEWITTSIPLSKYDSWLMGYRYVYTIAFQKDRIYFAPNADTMGSGTGGGIVIE